MDPTHVYMRRHLTYPTYVICPLCPGPANQPTKLGPLAENKSTLVPFFVFYTHIMYFWAAITVPVITRRSRKETPISGTANLQRSLLGVILYSLSKLSRQYPSLEMLFFFLNSAASFLQSHRDSRGWMSIYKSRCSYTHLYCPLGFR